MGYSTQYVSVSMALTTLRKVGFEVHSASCASFFLHPMPRKNQIATAEVSDHDHIILRLKNGGFIDYQLIK